MQITSDTHTHTISSGHAYSSLQENVYAAKEAGLKLIAVTDHGVSMPGAPHPWYFINMKVLPRVMAGVGILRGMEANILNEQGDLDIDETLSASLDVVIASFHEPVIKPSNSENHTQALLNVIKSGRVQILGHLGNPNFPFDIDTVVAAAAQHHVMIEINNSSFVASRPGSAKNCKRIAEAARDLGAYLSISSDAHVATQIGDYRHSIALLEEVNFPLVRLVSTAPEKLLKQLELAGKNIADEWWSL